MKDPSLADIFISYASHDLPRVEPIVGQLKKAGYSVWWDRQLQGGTIQQVHVQHFERTAGVSKFNIFNRSIKPLQDAFAYRWMRSRYINYSIEKSSSDL